MIKNVELSSAGKTHDPEKQLKRLPSVSDIPEVEKNNLFDPKELRRKLTDSKRKLKFALKLKNLQKLTIFNRTKKSKEKDRKSVKQNKSPKPPLQHLRFRTEPQNIDNYSQEISLKGLKNFREDEVVSNPKNGSGGLEEVSGPAPVNLNRYKPAGRVKNVRFQESGEFGNEHDNDTNRTLDGGGGYDQSDGFSRGVVGTHVSGGGRFIAAAREDIDVDEINDDNTMVSRAAQNYDFSKGFTRSRHTVTTNSFFQFFTFLDFSIFKNF